MTPIPPERPADPPAALPAGWQVRLAPLALLAGFACAVGTVAVYQDAWGLALGVAVTVLTVIAAPPGWGTRLPFAVGDAVAVGGLAVPRSEGDYLVTATVSGYVVLGLTLVLVVFSLATLPRPGRRAPTADTPGGAPPPPGPE